MQCSVQVEGIINLGQGGRWPKLEIKLAEWIVAEPQSSWSVGVKGLEDWEGSRLLGGKSRGSIVGPICTVVSGVPGLELEGTSITGRQIRSGLGSFGAAEACLKEASMLSCARGLASRRGGIGNPKSELRTSQATRSSVRVLQATNVSLLVPVQGSVA